MNPFRSISLLVAMAMLIGLGSLAAADEDPHAAHRKQALEANYRVTSQALELPKVTLVDAFGQSVELARLIGDRHNTLVSFIFTSCAGICPMITANMARAVPALNAIDADYQIVLITVDPEYDTPARLAEYGNRFRTGSEIRFLTGASDDVFEVLRTLDVLYEGSNKMNHQPVTLMAARGDREWRRIDGLIGSEVVAEQYRRLIEPPGQSG